MSSSLSIASLSITSPEVRFVDTRLVVKNGLLEQQYQHGSVRFGNIGAVYLASRIASLSFDSLNVSGHMVGDDGLNAIATALPKTVTCLIVSDNMITAKSISSLMQKNQLKVLVCERCLLLGRSIVELETALKENAVLEHLSLRFCNIANSVGANRCLLNMTSLRSLNLSVNHLSSDEFVSTIATVLDQTKNNRLTSLSMQLRLSMPQLHSLFHTITHHQPPVVLRALSVGVVESEASMSLIELIEKGPLASIDCSLARYDDNVLCALLEALKSNTTMHAFHVNNALKLTIVDQLRLTTAIADCISQNRTLTHLMISKTLLFVPPTFLIGDLTAADCASRDVQEALRNNFALLEHDFISAETLPFINRNKALRWSVVHPNVVDMCIAMAPLELPPYIMLWIIDWLPHYNYVSHHRKIRLIESIRNSIRKVKKIVIE